MKRRLLPFALLLLAGCGSIIRNEFLDRGTKDFDFRDPDCGPSVVAVPRDAVEVRYLGSGGVYIRWGDDAILLGPYFSRPGNIVRPVTGRIAFDAARIGRGMEGIGEVRAILAGHSHFDHIGDVPFIVQRYAPNASVYVNDAGVTELTPYADIKAVSFEKNHDAWIKVGNAIRFMPVPSDHAPQLCGWHRWPCTYADGPPKRKWTDWKNEKLSALRGGNTFAFVIDLLGTSEDDVRYRIYYNDAASSPGKGVPQLHDGRAYDLAILCMASFHLVTDYPEALLRALRPRHVLVSHYDDFFARQSGRYRFAPLLTNGRAGEFFGRLKDKLAKLAPQPEPPVNFVCGPHTALWSMPVPHWTIFFTPASKGKP